MNMRADTGSEMVMAGKVMAEGAVFLAGSRRTWAAGLSRYTHAPETGGEMSSAMNSERDIVMRKPNLAVLQLQVQRGLLLMQREQMQQKEQEIEWESMMGTGEPPPAWTDDPDP